MRPCLPPIHSSVSLLCSVLAAFVALAAFGCGEDKQAADVTPSGPIVGVLDLAVSLRSGGKASGEFHDVEVSSTAVNVGGQPALTLTDGLIAAADRQGEQLPKLESALSKPSRTSMVLSVSSSVSYDTAVSVLAAAKAAGVQSVAFKVRPPGGGATTGFLTLDQTSVRAKSKADEEVVIPGAPVKPWSDFATQWEAVQSACRAAQSGNCAYKPEKIAEGGNLKIVLYAAGQGVNAGFYRVGAPPPEAEPAPAAAEPTKKGAAAKKAAKAAKKKKQKPELIDGVKAPVDPMKELEEAPPATEAVFQFRAQEAVTPPSAVSGTLQPVCGSSACGVVVQAEKATLFVRVLGLLGAAFPDGSPAPVVAFER
jgi:biopolymer transport protein ExbD